jgi:hypothetical protein
MLPLTSRSTTTQWDERDPTIAGLRAELDRIEKRTSLSPIQQRIAARQAVRRWLKFSEVEDAKADRPWR